MPRYKLTWSPADKGAIENEIQGLKGREPIELSRVMAYIAQVAKDGKKVTTQNFHSAVSGKNMHSACPFGVVGIYYAYASSPATEVYILGFFANHFAHYATAAARLANVP